QAQLWHAAGSIPDSVLAVCGNAATGNLLAGTPNGVYVSLDTGKNWTKSAALPDQRVTVLVALPSGTVLCGTASGLFSGPDKGPWSATNVTSPVTAISLRGTAGTKDGKIFRTDSLAKTWTLVATASS